MVCIHQTGITIFVNGGFRDHVLDGLQADIHPDDPHRFIFHINRYYIRNHTYIDILIQIGIHPGRLFILHRYVIPPHMLQIIFFKCTKIRRFDTFKPIFRRISGEEQSGSRLCKIRIVSDIRRKCSIRLFGKMAQRIFQSLGVRLHILRIRLKFFKICQITHRNICQSIYRLLDLCKNPVKLRLPLLCPCQHIILGVTVCHIAGKQVAEYSQTQSHNE